MMFQLAPGATEMFLGYFLIVIGIAGLHVVGSAIYRKVKK